MEISSKELLAEAHLMKWGKSLDYCEGFEAGAIWMLQRIERGICQTSQSKNSEEE
ncbi:unnamed protein product [marine sediment metagenome]|uniref:Uncharacterized protein n=1 Tax=marine sediment metagenome TaxID=412755 RepID=X1A9W7_9ZZZZ